VRCLTKREPVEIRFRCPKCGQGIITDDRYTRCDCPRCGATVAILPDQAALAQASALLERAQQDRTAGKKRSKATQSDDLWGLITVVVFLLVLWGYSGGCGP